MAINTATTQLHSPVHPLPCQICRSVGITFNAHPNFPQLVLGGKVWITGEKIWCVQRFILYFYHDGNLTSWPTIINYPSITFSARRWLYSYSTWPFMETASSLTDLIPWVFFPTPITQTPIITFSFLVCISWDPLDRIYGVTCLKVQSEVYIVSLSREGVIYKDIDINTRITVIFV